MAGGAAGTLSRYFLGIGFQKTLGTNFPYGTLAVNLIGCALMGIFTVLGAGEKGRPLQMAMIIGFCGAFTTFSAFIFELSDMSRQGQSFKALAYLLLSVIAGFVCFRVGVAAGEYWVD